MSLDIIKSLIYRNELNKARQMIRSLDPSDYIFGQIYEARINESDGEYQRSIDIIDNLMATKKLTDAETYAAVVAKIYAMMRLALFDAAIGLSEGIISLPDESPELFVDHRDWVGTFNHVMGTVYHYKGDLDTAYEYYSKSLSIREGLALMSDLGSTVNNMGLLFRQRGE